jgi:hypothetical protein
MDWNNLDYKTAQGEFGVMGRRALLHACALKAGHDGGQIRAGHQ